MTDISIPSYIDGSAYSFMRWEKVVAQGSPQLELKKRYEHYNSLGIGDIDGRNVIACTKKFGRVGDALIIEFSEPISPNNYQLNAIIGDIKDENDKNCDEWGHIYGSQHSIIEFVVDTSFPTEEEIKIAIRNNQDFKRINSVIPSLNRKNKVIKIKNLNYNYLCI